MMALGSLGMGGATDLGASEDIVGYQVETKELLGGQVLAVGRPCNPPVVQWYQLTEVAKEGWRHCPPCLS